MSNMFLHRRQVIDSKLQKLKAPAEKLWNCLGIRPIRFLNKQDSSRAVRVDFWANSPFAPFNPPREIFFLNSDLLDLVSQDQGANRWRPLPQSHSARNWLVPLLSSYSHFNSKRSLLKSTSWSNITLLAVISVFAKSPYLHFINSHWRESVVPQNCRSTWGFWPSRSLAKDKSAKVLADGNA